MVPRSSPAELASTPEIGRALAVVLTDCVPASPHLLLHSLLLQAEGGLLAASSMEPIRRPLQEVLEEAGLEPSSGSASAESGGESRHSERLQACHEQGHRGRQLPKEAHTVAKMLMRIGGHLAQPPIRQPWVVKSAGLGMQLLLPPGGPRYEEEPPCLTATRHRSEAADADLADRGVAQFLGASAIKLRSSYIGSAAHSARPEEFEDGRGFTGRCSGPQAVSRP
ncbi:unnamed protein product [Polarella glacialis]|uniref:Uncharacterized protein n=1 Tax=Polarella glacialis TaxID=89957 RepID=A0A813LHF8_POLGL|nr:unnamed protein product [Polarella glacialis]